jgi:hypothetical protein
MVRYQSAVVVLGFQPFDVHSVQHQCTPEVSVQKTKSLLNLTLSRLFVKLTA